MSDAQQPDPVVMIDGDGKVWYSDQDYDALARQLEYMQQAVDSLRLDYKRVNDKRAELERQLAESQIENTGLHDACARHIVENSKLNELYNEAQQRIADLITERNNEAREALYWSGKFGQAEAALAAARRA